MFWGANGEGTICKKHNLFVHLKERFEISEMSPLATTNITSYHSVLRIAPAIRSENEGVLKCAVYSYNWGHFQWG